MGRITKLLKRPLFWAVFIIPNLATIAYYGYIASPVYTSEASLVVYHPSLGHSQNLHTMLSGNVGGLSLEGGNILANYIKSWGAFKYAQNHYGLAQHYRQGDYVSRFGGLLDGFNTSDITLWRYYRQHVDISVNKISSIVSIKVDGYTPGFTKRLTEGLLHESQLRLDKLNHHVLNSFTHLATAKVKSLTRELEDANHSLREFRQSVGVYNPNQQYRSKLSLTNTLSAKRDKLLAQLKSLRQATPHNPVIGNLTQRATALARRIHRILVSTTHGSNSLAYVEAHYNMLTEQQTNLESLLRQAQSALQQAQISASRDRYFLEVISHPSQPHSPSAPDRAWWISVVFFSSLLIWGFVR